MTQEYKQLLLIDLCARLPYGVKSQNRWIDVNKNEHLYIDKIKWIDENYIRTDGEGKYYFLERIKPILFPLSAINQEIKVNGEKITIGCTWKDTSLPELETRFRIDKEGNLFYDVCGALVPLNDYTHAIDTFNRYHIDYRGLIAKGLAISVFDLHENPYK